MPYQKINAYFSGRFPDLKNSTLFIFYTLAATFIRLPFFFRDYIDRDESTFILMGQSLVDGYLPYTELWDLKPPLLFFFFGAIIFLFGKSFIAIRLTGTLIIALSSYILYKIGKNTHSRASGFWAGLLYIYLSSLFGSLQGVMSEHLSIGLFLIGFYYLSSKWSLKNLMFSGLWFGLSLMVKSNLVYALFLISLSIVYISFKESAFKIAIRHCVVFAFGVILGLFLIFLPYLASGLEDLFIDSVFKAPLSYKTADWKDQLSTLPIILTVMVLVGLHIKFLNHFSKQNYIFILAAIAGIVYSFFSIGKINGHYLVQLFPFILLLLATFLITLPKLKPQYCYVLLVLLLLAPFESYKEYFFIGNHYKQHGTLYNGEGIDIPNYLEDKITDNDKLYFTEYHIGYWLLDKKPLTKITTHPSNINREALFPFIDKSRTTSLEELRYILEEQQPRYIVIRKGKAPFGKQHPTLNMYLENQLKFFYTNTHEIGKGIIYERITSFEVPQ